LPTKIGGLKKANKSFPKYTGGEDMEETSEIRNVNVKKLRGRPFEKGNKSGGRKPIPPEIKEALTGLVPRAIERLTEIINTSDNDKIVMQAVEVVLNRVYGKPAQSLDIESNNNHTLEVVLTGQLKEWAK
jgi:hypothetical protein